MNKEQLQWLVIVFVAVGLVVVGIMIVDLNSRVHQVSDTLATISSQMQNLSQKHNAPAATSQPVAVPVQQAPSIQAVSATGTQSILATSPDDNFDLAGYGTCEGVFSISKTGSDAAGQTYDLGYRESTDVPETQDLGGVIVQTLTQYAATDLDASYRLAFKTNTMVVNAWITNAATVYHDVTQGCTVKIVPAS